MASSSNPGKVACIWGANGISGMAMIEIITQQPRNEWSKIISISRRPILSDIKDDRIHFISIDIMKASIDEIASELSAADGQKITHMFHYTYIEKADDNELDQVNKALLQKALDATKKVAGKNVQCVMLQTGYKYYGVHKGGKHVAPLPFTEDAPRHEGVNFYYTQEDLIKEYAQQNHWNYVITRPNVIIGVSKGNFMNFVLSLAIYAVIQKEKGEPLIYPGSETGWNVIVDHSSSWINARFQLWSSTNQKTLNQAFNIHNGDEFRFRNIWPKIEKYFGFAHHEQKFPADKNAPQLIISEYMPKQKELWHQIAKHNNIDESAFEYSTWTFMDAIVNIPFDVAADLSKARKFGWTTKIDSADCFIECFDKLKKMKIIPN
ncbi:unnamed protein product [Rotaria sp. Silwood1]|nr:unnamed protein product [Rotaria sp. Silwood1]CAF1657990.1 unnamed protein product [Rotaria sp. Silwood1]CAF3890980.1 unnamed protein product [Rotaria sp. Silwood1]CAF3891335.1 unnamed protein product [Rotaria sp. Silwood1]CAF4933132.1 unnamed protein product [Rotaria sp. Silwood1]